MIGTTLSHYKIVSKLGEGGMGEVYLAEDTKLKRKVALKVLPPEMASDSNRLERFQREAEAVAALDHPNIVTIYSVEESGGAHFLTMSYIEGESLGERVPRGGMDLDQLFEIAIPLADALAAAHEKGVTHRDLKPANIMITSDGRVKVLDFGLAKLAEDALPHGEDEPTQALTREGLVVGTVPYMSPEQVEGKPVDPRTDIFSLGVLLYEMATGDRPFRGENSAQVVSSILRDDPPTVAERKAELPFHLSRIVRHCLEKDPKKRYQSALDLKNELQGLEEEVASGHLRPASSSTVIPAQPISSSDTIQAQPLSGSEVIEAQPTAPVPEKAKPKWLWPAVGAAVLVVLAALWLGRDEDAAPSPAITAETGGLESAETSSEKPTVAVLYFDNLTGDAEQDWLRTGLTDMLVTDLSQITAIKMVGTDRIYSILKDLDMLENPVTSAEVVRQVAVRAGAQTVLLGSFAKAGDTLRINVKVQDATSGEILSTERVDGPGGDNIFNLVDELSDGVRQHFDVGGEAIPVYSDRMLMNVTTTSVEAYRYYAEGIHLGDQGKDEEAIPLLEKAVEIDPTFAMALRKLAVSLSNQGRLAESDDYAQKAVDNADRLPPRERYLVEAFLYQKSPSNMVPALQAYKSLLELEPDYDGALNNLGLQYGLMERWEEALPYYEHGMAIGSHFQFLYVNFADALANLGSIEETRRPLDRLRQREPDSFVVDLGEGNIALNFAGDPRGALERFARLDATRAGASAAQDNPMYAHVLLEQWSDARAVADSLASSHQATNRRLGLEGMGVLALYNGQPSRALELYQQAVSEYAALDVERADRLMALGFLQLELDQPRKAIDTFSRALETGKGSWQELDLLWGLSHAHARNGDKTTSDAIAARHREIADLVPSQKWVRQNHELLGFNALALDDISEAIGKLELAESMLPPTPGARGEFTEVWFGLAEGYLAAGDTTKAVEKLEQILGVGRARAARPIQYVRSLYLLGQLALERGDLEQSKDYYRRFLDYWGEGEMDRDRVTQAKRVVGS